ncbi:ExbD/TolR family protein [Candidatus Poribacteria bacterium]
MRGLLRDYSSSLERKNPNLAPLIDVVFQLILFFLVTSSFTWYSGMTVKLPEASSAVTDRPPETITLEITRADESAQNERLIVRWWEENIVGELFWPLKENEDPAAGMGLLRIKLDSHKRGLEEGRQPAVVVAAQDSVPYQSVITVIDMCAQMGFTDIVLAAHKTPSSIDNQ